MIIKTEADVTTAVLAEVQRAQDPRFREIMTSLIKHLHGFIRETRLTEQEFQQACAIVNRIGQRSNESHNEAVLMCGSLGMSSLVCLLNNGDNGNTETTANLLGPFWRDESPRTENGGSLLRSPTEGVPLYVEAWVNDRAGKPVAGADVDVWHCNDEGYYENQDPSQADMNLRGKFTTDANGKIWFSTIKPIGYPIPLGGPTGDLLRTLRRHNMRPAHLHFLIVKEGFKAHISQVYSSDDPNLETDSQFGVTERLIGHYVRHENEPVPYGEVKGPWYSLEFTFELDPGEPKLPRVPISGKSKTVPQPIERLVRA
jgi:hydroxyquinol 1,2-dioxygenase